MSNSFKPIHLLMSVAIVSACDNDPATPDGAEVAGFRIMQGSSERLEWREGQNVGADTLFLTEGQNMTVTFVWIDASGDEVDISDGGELDVAISNAGAAEWIPDGSDPFRGTFDPGPFSEVETAMRVTLTQVGDTLFRSPLLQLHVRPE